MRHLPLLLILCLLLPVCALAQDEGELLKNPGFDIDADGDNVADHWSSSANAIRRQEVQAFSGNYELVSLPGAYVLATQDTPLKKGQQYNLRLRLRCEGGAMGGALLLHGPERPTREFSIVWNIEGSDKYEDFIATFTAPDPVCRLYIYNVARKGTIYYDSLSLREGSPDQLIVQQFSIPKIDRPLDEPPVTPHIPYARPLSGGPLKTFVALRSFRSMREVTELGQRIEMDADVLNCGYEGDEVVSETARRMMQRLDEDFYEVYLVSSKTSAPAVKAIKERVEKGAGLVVIEGFGQAGKFLDTKSLTEAPADHPVLRGVPFELMPQGMLTSAQVGQLGKGRVVRLNFPYTTCRVWGLIPIGLKSEDWQSRQWDYWEGWLSLLGKAMLWAGRGEAQTQPATAQVIYRSGREIRFNGPNLRLPPQAVAVDAQGQVALKAPAELPAGPVLADVMLRDKDGRTVDWRTEIIKAPQQASIMGLEAGSLTVAPGEPVALALTVSAPAAVDVTVEATLIDAFGRNVSAHRSAQKLATGESIIKLALPLPNPICVHHKAFVRVLAGNREQDSAWVAVRVPELGAKLAAADFVATTWGPGTLHPLCMDLLGAQTRALDLNSEFAINGFIAGEHGMLNAGYAGGSGAFRETSHGGDVRTQCLSDPAVVEKYTTAAKEIAPDQALEGLYAAGITDEAFLSYHNQRQELCFSPYCVARFQKWLQVRYPSLEALNAQWGTTYKSWDEVRGAKTEEIRGQENFGRFVDFRTFMTDVWIDACKTITDAYHEVNPAIPVGHTNTFGVNPFNGNDYWKLATQTGFGWGQEYSEAIKGSGNKAIFDIWRSFIETPEARKSRALGPETVGPFFNYGWIGYDRREAAAWYEPWWLALHDSRGVSYYATASYDPPRGRSWALVYPDGRHTPYSQEVRRTLADLREGCGKVFMEYPRRQPQVGILWSHPSMLVAWCESKEDVAGDPPEAETSDSYASWFMSALNFRQHLNELQLDYQFIAPDQILTSDVLKQYPMLILPFTIAASEPLVQKLEQYVADGGVIVGDMRCLRTDEHGKPDASGALKRLFGVTRNGKADYAESKLAFSAAAEGVDMTGQEMTVYGKEGLAADGARALAAHATGEPAVLVMPRGKGLSVYLNCKLPRYDVAMRELVRQIVTRSGVQREVTVQAASSDVPPRAWELNTFTRGPITVHGLIRDHRRCSDSDPVTISFGRKAHVYDMRTKEYAGQVDRVQATVPPGGTALYALLPYRVSRMQVKAPAAVKAGEELVAQVSVAAGGKPGDHVVHVELINPQGQALWHYARNELLPGGQGSLRVPLALNEARGKWTVRVRDVLTGTEGEAGFAVQ